MLKLGFLPIAGCSFWNIFFPSRGVHAETCRKISRIDLLNVIPENSRKFSRMDIGYYKCILSILEIFVQVPDVNTSCFMKILKLFGVE